jgi:hypothetical protein
MIREDIGRKTTKDKGDGMIMGTMGRRKDLGVVKNRSIFREKRLYVGINHRGMGLNCLNGMELCNNAKVTFFE